MYPVGVVKLVWPAICLLTYLGRDRLIGAGFDLVGRVRMVRKAYDMCTQLV